MTMAERAVAHAFSVALPWTEDLSVNHAYGRRAGRTYLKRGPLRWRDSLAWQVRTEYHEVRRHLPGRIVVSWQVYAPDGRRRDVSNYGKLILDGVQMGLEIDDAAFSTGECRPVVPGSLHPRIEVVVEVLRLGAA